ncbi:hypothetical protein LJR153_002157 [Paenibacillus sp. LjRoot153]
MPIALEARDQELYKRKQLVLVLFLHCTFDQYRGADDDWRTVA